MRPFSSSDASQLSLVPSPYFRLSFSRARVPFLSLAQLSLSRSSFSLVRLFRPSLSPLSLSHRSLPNLYRRSLSHRSLPNLSHPSTTSLSRASLPPLTRITGRLARQGLAMGRAQLCRVHPLLRPRGHRNGHLLAVEAVPGGVERAVSGVCVREREGAAAGEHRGPIPARQSGGAPGAVHAAGELSRECNVTRDSDCVFAI